MSQARYCTRCGDELASNAEFCKSCGAPVSPPIAQTVTVSSRPPRFPLRVEHKILIGLAMLSVTLAFLVPLASAPQKLTSIETKTTTLVNPYLTTYVHLETRTITTRYTRTWTETSSYTATYTATVYLTTVIYTGGTGLYIWTQTGTGTGTGTATGVVPGVTVVIPIQIQRTQVQSTLIQRTETMGVQQTVTETSHNVVQQVSSAVETVRQTATLPYSSAVIRSYLDNVAWLGVAIMLPFIAYHRINAYRSRHHIYYQILSYTAYSPRLPSHVMRACNLETRKFTSYIQKLKEKGFVEEIPQDGGKLYRASREGLSLIRDENLAKFIRELP